ncbi:MAG: hypothetical protein WA040_16910 [Anaerolineae bacterium]
MKTISQPSVINPSIIVLGVLAAAVTFLAWRGTSLPLLSSPKISLAIVLLLGMAICAQGGIGRVAAAGQWMHPLSIAGYLLGAAILLLAAAVFFNISLPFIASPQQALVVVAALMAGKVFISVVHYLLDRL